MKHIYAISIAFAFVVCNLSGMQPRAQKILFFRGMSTLGKGAICRAMMLKDPQWQIVSDDDCIMESELEFCKNQFPEQFAKIARVIAPENLFHAIKRNEVFYRPETTEKDRVETHRALKYIQGVNNIPGVYKHEEVKKNTVALIKSRILGALKNNHHVINDSWMLTEADFQEFAQDYQVIKAYCYIPLDMLIRFLINTDSDALKTGKLKNKRSFWHILNSFERLLMAQPKDKPLDTVTKQDLLSSLKQIKNELPEEGPEMQPFTHHEMTVKDLEERRKKYLARFGVDEEISLWPDLSYDIIIEKKQSSDCSYKKAQELLTLIAAKSE